MVISQYFSIRPASLVVPLTLVSRIGCFRGSVWIPSRSVVRWSMKLSIALLSNRAVSTVDCSAHTVKGMFIFCMLWYTRFGLFALPQVVVVQSLQLHHQSVDFFLVCLRLGGGCLRDGGGVSWLGRGALGFGVGRRFVGLLGAFPGHVSLDFAVKASSFFLYLFLVLGEGSSGLGRVHFHGDRIVFLFSPQRGLPLLFPVFPFLRGSGESQILFNCVSLVFLSGRCLPLVDGFWPLRLVHTGLC